MKNLFIEDNLIQDCIRQSHYLFLKIFLLMSSPCFSILIFIVNTIFILRVFNSFQSYTYVFYTSGD